MTHVSLHPLVKLSVAVLCISVFAGCASASPMSTLNGNGSPASENPTGFNAEDFRLVADESASTNFQLFLDTWAKDGVTIAETPAIDGAQLVAFTDGNGNGVLEAGEPVLAEVEGDMSDVLQLATSQTSSGVVTGRCFTNSFVVNPGEYSYRERIFVVGFVGRSYAGGRACQLTLSLSSEPFPGEKWEGLLKGTSRNEPFFGGWFIWPSTTTVLIEIPIPTNGEVLDETYGRDGELAIVSQSEENPEQYPKNRMIIGSWKSEVTSGN
jgi:hypothetical protein